jgi:2-polyprenyl-6-hydroxyphenyl methylase/3-demethylubiquinone-9 3-methyltransferase
MKVRKKTMMNTHAEELLKGERFGFGANWTDFLEHLNDERIQEAETLLKQMLDVESLNGISFLDIGSGSGLFSLVARRLGARVHSFDYDPQSVACAEVLKARFFPDDNKWTIEEGSVLDVGYIRSLGKFDIVYSWGVLHHTGEMWKALENAYAPVAEEGKLFIAIYNDQGWVSQWWRMVKRFYCSGKMGRAVVIPVYFSYWFFGGVIKDLLMFKNPMNRYTEYWRQRGMSRTHDWIDWLGGYPFEVAKPEEIFDFYRDRGFVLQRLNTCAGGLGCNEFVFRRESIASKK